MEDREEWATYTDEGERVEVVYQPPSDIHAVQYSLMVDN